MTVLELTGEDLTIEKIKDFLGNSDAVVEITDEGYRKINASRKIVENIIREGKTIYGITTGFGLFCDVLISKEKAIDLQANLIRSHCCGVGRPFSEDAVLVMMILRLNTLVKGHSGVTADLADQLKTYINERIIPKVPEQGSLGASGDLAPLAHIAITLMGEGEVYYEGELRQTADVLEMLGIIPLTLREKEGLAMINGTQPMTAQGVLNYIEAEHLMEASLWIAALTHQALNGITDAYNEKVHASRGYTAQIYAAERMREYLEGSRLTTRQGEVRVQDAYSIRCIPQVHGASFQTLEYVKDKLETEMNAANDNPLIFSEEEVFSGGNFHGQPIAVAMDLLKIGAAEIANISERRIERLVNPALNGDLPAFLSPEEGFQSGAMILQYAAASLVSENKTLAHPASVDSIPSSANQEDHVSMGTIGARHARDIIDNMRNVLAIELLIALTAVELKGKEKLSPKTRKKFEEYRLVADFIEKDRVFSMDIENLSLALSAVK